MTMQWLDDRLNPILVKEVRQALRSRYFWGTYALALAAATIIGSFLLGMVDDPDELGAVFFGVVYFCLAASTMGLVPFQAFLAAGGTWDAERTNLLLLTALTPRQIVQGRLMASVVQIEVPGGKVSSATKKFVACCGKKSCGTNL